MLSPIRTSRNTFFKRVCFFLFVCSLTTHEITPQYFSAEKTFRAGISAFNDKNYYSARLLFQEILHKELRGHFSEKAQYYLALTHYYEKDYQSALFELRTFLRDHPNSEEATRARYWFGESYYFLKDHTKARESHYQLVRDHKDDPITAYALYTIGYSYLREKRYDEAIAEFSRILKDHPKSKITPEAALQLGITHFRNIEYKEAQKIFRDIILNYKNENLAQESQLWIGKSFFMEKKYNAAMKQFQFVLDKEPNLEIAAESTYQMALIKFRLNDHSSSSSLLKKILEKYPSWSKIDRVYFRLGQIHYQEKAKEDAVRYLKKLLKEHKESVYYADALSLYSELVQTKGNVAGLISFLDQIIAGGLSQEQYLKVLRKKADILFQAGEYQKTLKVYQELYEKTPPSPARAEILYMKAQSNYKLNLYEQSLIETKEIIENKNYFLWKPDAYFLQGEIHFALGNHTLALQKYSQLARFYPKHRRAFDASMGIGWSYFELKQYARSRDRFRKLLKQYKKPHQKVTIQMALAACEYNLRDFKSAVKTYRTVLKQAKEFPEEAEEALFRMGWARYREGKYGISESIFSRYRKAHSGGKFLLEAKYFGAWSGFHQKKYREAAKVFREVALASPPENPLHRKALLQYAKSEYVLKRYQTTWATTLRLMDQFPDSEEIEESLYVHIICSLKLKKPEDALGSLKKLRKAAPDSSYLKELLYNISDYYKEYGDFDQAHRLLEEVLEQSGKESEKWLVQISRVDLFMAQGKKPQAIGLLKSILANKNDQLIPYKAETLNRLFEIHFNDQAYEEIFQGFKEYKELFRSDENMDHEIKLWEGRIWMRKKDHDKAEQIFKKLVQNKRHGFTARYYLGLNYYLQGSRDKAYDFLKQVAEKSKNRLAPQARFKVAEIRFFEKKYKKALLQYTKVVYLYSDISDLYEKALYKLILCFRHLKRNKDYSKYLAKLSEEFPLSKYLQEFE